MESPFGGNMSLNNATKLPSIMSDTMINRLNKKLQDDADEMNNSITVLLGGEPELKHSELKTLESLTKNYKNPAYGKFATTYESDWQKITAEIQKLRKKNNKLNDPYMQKILPHISNYIFGLAQSNTQLTVNGTRMKLHWDPSWTTAPSLEEFITKNIQTHKELQTYFTALYKDLGGNTADLKVSSPDKFAQSFMKGELAKS